MGVGGRLVAPRPVWRPSLSQFSCNVRVVDKYGIKKVLSPRRADCDGRTNQKIVSFIHQFQLIENGKVGMALTKMQWCACGNLASGRDCLWRSSSRPCSASNILEMSKISSSIPIAAAAALFVVSMSPNSRSPKASLYLFGSSLTQLNSSCRNESLPERRREGDHPKSPEKTIKERGKDNSFSPSPSSTSSSSSSPSERAPP